MLKIPYGISDFATLRKEGYLYQDRTGYIRSMEGFGEAYGSHSGGIRGTGQSIAAC